MHVDPVDLSCVQLRSLGQRPNKVALAGMARPHQPGQSFADFLASLPRLMLVEDLRAVVGAIVQARRAERPVIVGMGGHVIKCGLGPILIDLLERRVITALALNGSAAIHDFEIALIGATSEDVAQGLKDGSFGMVRETGERMNQAINRVLEHSDKGMGELLGEHLNHSEAPCREYSVLAAARRLSVPLTVHVAIGCDIIHMHPSADGAALGRATFNDFKLFCGVVRQLTGGVYVNIGSAVLMPEVFLKAFSIAQNLGSNLQDFVTVNMDMLGHYRPGENVVRRPASVGGRGYTLLGRHEILVPLLAALLIETFSCEQD